MPEYRLYHFKGDHIRSVSTLSAPDDVEAIVRAERMVDGTLAELWRGGRKVQTFDAAKLP